MVSVSTTEPVQQSESWRKIQNLFKLVLKTGSFSFFRSYENVFQLFVINRVGDFFSGEKKFLIPFLFVVHEDMDDT